MKEVSAFRRNPRKQGENYGKTVPVKKAIQKRALELTFRGLRYFDKDDFCHGFSVGGWTYTISKNSFNQYSAELVKQGIWERTAMGKFTCRRAEMKDNAPLLFGGGGGAPCVICPTLNPCSQTLYAATNSGGAATAIVASSAPTQVASSPAPYVPSHLPPPQYLGLEEMVQIVEAEKLLNTLHYLSDSFPFHIHNMGLIFGDKHRGLYRTSQSVTMQNSVKNEKIKIDRTTVSLALYKDGRTRAYIGCSRNPFRIQQAEDIEVLEGYLRSLQARLEATANGALKPYQNWFMERIEFNIDVPYNRVDALVYLNNMTFRYCRDIFAIYVKNMQQGKVIRSELRCNNFNLFFGEAVKYVFKPIIDRIDAAKEARRLQY